MARWWKGVALVGWLGASALARAQGLPPAGTTPPAASAPAEGQAKAEATEAAAPGAYGPVPPYFPHPVPAPPPAIGGGGGPDNAFSVDPLPKIPPNKFLVNLDYLLWYLPRQPVPALFTFGDLGDLVPGALGQPGTRNIVDAVPDGAFNFNGAKLTLGACLDCEGFLSVEASYFVLENRSAVLRAESDGGADTAVIARPFFNVVANREDADPVAIPNLMAGRAVIELPQRFNGGDLLLRCTVANSTSRMARFSLLFAGRYLALDEKLIATEEVRDLPGLGVPGNIYGLTENFTTYNRFYGGQFGGEVVCGLGPLTLEVSGRLGFGDMRQEVRVAAVTVITEPDGTVTSGTNQGLLVGPGNAGKFGRDRYTFVPEGAVRIGYAFNEYVSLRVGYSFIYLDEVLRPGNQIDRRVNVQPVGAQGLPQPLAPLGPVFGGSHFWAQGLDLGVQVRF